MTSRREFITLLSGAAAWPAAARAQQAGMPVVALLFSGSSEGYGQFIAPFRQALNEIGYVEGRDVAIEVYWAEGQYDRLPAMAADLVRRQVAIIVAAGGMPSALAAKGATQTIPIVFTNGSDPIKFGLVASLNRPGGNLTGVTQLTVELGAKRLELAHQLLPAGSAVAMLVNPDNPNQGHNARDAEAVARALGRPIHILYASSAPEIEAAFASLMGQPAGAMVIGGDPYLVSQRDQIVALAARHAVATIGDRREFAAAGGLISYGTSFVEMYRQVGTYAGRILKGEKPSDLPVMQPTKFELVINLKSAKALSLEIPPILLALADEVIE